MKRIRPAICSLEGCNNPLPGPKSLFCSRACKRIDYESKLEVCTRAECNNKRFNKKALYCSIACRRLDFGLPVKPRVCALEGCHILAPRIDQIYCCNAHRKMDTIGLKLKFTFPKWKCEMCGKSIKLKFDPRVDTMKWREFKCPACGVSRLSTGSILDKY